MLILPPRDAVAVSQGDLTSKASDQPIEKVISADLESMAPDVVQLLQGSQFLPLGFSLCKSWNPFEANSHWGVLKGVTSTSLAYETEGSYYKWLPQRN